ncbi:MAG: hypothetical protein MZW92_40390 [Comamonadaceae bacterium]|nr:hypothetical protein [Comamonadaceae bacterium]
MSFVVFARAAGRPAAYVWLVLRRSPARILREALRRAMNEGVLLAALAVLIWATFRASGRTRSTARAVASSGGRPGGWSPRAVAAGLAAQTKLNGSHRRGSACWPSWSWPRCAHQMCGRRRAGHAGCSAPLILAGSETADLLRLESDASGRIPPAGDRCEVVRARRRTGRRPRPLRAGDARASNRVRSRPGDPGSRIP